jgi:hypothetical protein
MPKQVYNVVINSLNSTLETLANDNSNKSYYVDWSDRMPQGKYMLSFTFISEGNDVTNFATIPVVYSDIASSSNSSFPIAPNIYNNTQILGTLYPTSIHTPSDKCCFRADTTSNPSIYLSNRPFNNLFTIQILNNSSPPLAYLDEATIPVNIGTYMLILHFELYELY